MNLKSPKVIILLFIIWKAPNDETKHFLIELLPRIVIEHNDRPVMLSLEKAGFFDEFELLLWKLVYKTLKVWLDVFFLIAKH